MATNFIRAESPSKAEQKPVRHGSLAQPCAELSANQDLQNEIPIVLRKNQNYVNPPAGGQDANSAAPVDLAAIPTYNAAAQVRRNWADITEEVNPGAEEGFTLVQGRKRRRGSANSPTAAAPSSNPGGSRTIRRPQPSAGSVPRAQEIRVTRAHIAEARARQASSSEEHCVYIEHSPELEPFHYLRALDRMLGGTAGVIQITKVNGHQLLGLTNRGLAERLISEGLEVEGTLLRAFPFRKRAERITVGNLPFFVADSAVITALSPFGRVTSIAPKQMKAGPYVYVDGRRDVFITLHEGITIERLPTRLDINIKGQAWPAYLSSGIRCSRCHGQGHRRAICPLLAGLANNTRMAPPTTPAGVPPPTTSAPPQRSAAQPPAPAPSNLAMEVCSAPPMARAVLHPPAPRPSPPAAPALPMEETPSAPPPVIPAPSLQVPKNPVDPRSATPRHPEPTPPARPDFAAPRGPPPIQETLGPAAPTQDVVMSIVEENTASSASSTRNATGDDLVAFIEGNPNVSFARTDALGLGREEVLDLLSSRTKAQRNGPLLSPPQCDALVGLIGQILDLKPGHTSNLYKVLGQVRAELTKTPAAAPTPPLPAPRPAGPTPPVPYEEQMTEEQEDVMIFKIFRKLKHMTCLRPLYDTGIDVIDLKDAILFTEDTASLMTKLSPALKGVLAEFLGAAIELARSYHHDDANSAAPVDLAAIPTSNAAAQVRRNWADITEEVNPGAEEGFTLVQGRKRRRGSGNSPTTAAPSSNAGASRTIRRPQSSAGSVPRAQEIRATRAHIAEARARQASSSEEHCVYIEHSPELEPFHYLRALDRMLGGTAGVIQITKVNGHQLLGLTNRGLAERLISEGLEVEGTLLRAFPFRKRAERITVGNLPFFVADSAVITALSPYGRVTSIAPKQMKAGPYVYVDGRRDVFITLHEGITIERLPTRLDINIKGQAWPAYLSSGIRCSRCHGQGHRRAICPLLAGLANNTRTAPPTTPAGVPPPTTPAPPQRSAAQPPAPTPSNPAMEVCSAPPVARAALHSSAPRPSPPAAPAFPMEETPPAPPPVTPAPPLQVPKNPVDPRSATPRHPEPTPPARPDFAAPRGPPPIQETLGPAAPTQDVEMSIVEETTASSGSSTRNATGDDLVAFIEGNPSVSFARTDALGLGREEVLNLLSSRTKAQRNGPLLSPPQCDALVGLIGQILDLKPGHTSNLYKVLGQVRAELTKTPAAAPTPPLPAPRPAGPTPPVPHEEQMTEEQEDVMIFKIYRKLKHMTCLRPLYDTGIDVNDLKDAILFTEDRASLMTRLSPALKGVLAEFLGAAIELARGYHHDDANSAAPVDLAAIPTSNAAAQVRRNWADITEEVNPGAEEGFTLVQGRKRRRGSGNSPTTAAPSSNAGASRTIRRPQSSAGSVPRAQEIRATRAHIAEARARQASSSEEHCVYIEHSPELEPFHYLRALDRMLGGTAGVIQITKVNGHQLLGLTNRGLAERLISEGLEVEGTLLRAFPFRKRAERITVGNLPFFVADSAVITALSPYGRVTSIAPKQMKAGPYVYVDGRRDVFITLHEGITIERLPTRLDINIKGQAWPAYLSSGIRCSRCHGQGHRRAICPLLAGLANNTRTAPPTTPAGVPPPTTPAPPQRSAAQPPAPTPSNPAMEVCSAPPVARAALHSSAPRPSPPAAPAFPMEETPPAPPPVTPCSVPANTWESRACGPNTGRGDVHRGGDLCGLPSVSFAKTDALGLGREEVLDLLSSRTKAQRKGPLLSPPQCDALVGLIGQILDLKPGHTSNLYKVLGQVKAELRTTPAVPPTPTLPAPWPSKPTPPALHGEKTSPDIATPPPPLSTEFIDACYDQANDIIYELSDERYSETLSDIGVTEGDIVEAIIFPDDREPLLRRLSTQKRTTLAGIVSAASERARSSDPFVREGLRILSEMLPPP
ncbi:hypothetical protein LAZ67_4000359 [Cordylochernes scorpioides]|uniref:CCHC-type domain-containing protein n=1 Tax=Cordylochernes scorpioides TaxID=51811 RepID=A0ABY6KB99_9ARAC|nr:hypothetical protein LAZ67_4000359 [Cordylochernes scorpioides]